MLDERRHSLYFGVPRLDNGQTVKTGRGSSLKPQNMGKVENTRTSPLGASRGFRFFILCLGLARGVITHPGTGLVSACEANS